MLGRFALRATATAKDKISEEIQRKESGSDPSREDQDLSLSKKGSDATETAREALVNSQKAAANRTPHTPGVAVSTMSTNGGTKGGDNFFSGEEVDVSERLQS